MITAIAAVGRNRVIGSAGEIPWRIPEDWRRFKAVTWGSNLIMGRVTFDAIGDPLPGRTSIVISRDHPDPMLADVAVRGVPESVASDSGAVGEAVRLLADDALVEGLWRAGEAELPQEDPRASRTMDPPTRVIRVRTLEEALAACDPDRPVFVAGGAQVYALAWPVLTDLDITEVDQAPEGDAFFPEIDPALWQEVSRERHEGYAFVHYTRRQNSGA